MIPPSIPLIVYGAWVGESIGKLFIAGIFPGLLFAALFMAYIALNAILFPAKTPNREKVNLKKIVWGFKDILPMGMLISCVLGSIYFGVATPTEAAALGSFGAIIIAAAYRRLNWNAFKTAILETVAVNGMMFLIIVGTQIMSMVLSDLRIPTIIAGFVASAGIQKGLVFFLIVVMYLVLGCFIDALSMTLLTLPITYPLMMSLGFDSVWYGVIVTLMSEIALITPPVGMILFIIQGVSNESLSEVIYGTLPFLLLLLIGACLLYFFPGIATWLPEKMITAF
jgi:tripartite ATP-independent transporter DctM subunit